METLNHTSNGQNASRIRQEVFTALIQEIECETSNEIDIVGFSAQLSNYTIGFHGVQEDGHSLIIDDFGYDVQTSNGTKWQQCEPTEEQTKEMAKILKNKVKEIEEHREDERRMEALAQDEEDEIMTYGHPGALYSKFY